MDHSTTPQEKSALVEMAMRIHSATPNSAATEQIFSQFGIKHSKHQDRTHPEKIRKEVLLKMNTLSKFGPSPRQKCVFGDEDSNHFETDVSTPSQPEASTSINPMDPLHFSTMAREMVAEASHNSTDTAATTPLICTLFGWSPIRRSNHSKPPKDARDNIDRLANQLVDRLPTKRDLLNSADLALGRWRSE